MCKTEKALCKSRTKSIIFHHHHYHCFPGVILSSEIWWGEGGSQLVYQDSAKLHPGEIQSKGNFIVRILETREIIQIESYNPNDPQNPNE